MQNLSASWFQTYKKRPSWMSWNFPNSENFSQGTILRSIQDCIKHSLPGGQHIAIITILISSEHIHIVTFPFYLLVEIM